MEKVSTVISDALQEILVQASEAPIEASEAQSAIRYMNRFMAGLSAVGVDLGYTKVSSLGDYVTIPDGAYEGLIANLAVYLAGQYDRPVSASTAEMARQGKSAMYQLGVEIIPSSLAGFPIGSGNEGDSAWRNSHFFVENDEAVLTENNNYIATENNTGPAE